MTTTVSAQPTFRQMPDGGLLFDTGHSPQDFPDILRIVLQASKRKPEAMSADDLDQMPIADKRAVGADFRARLERLGWVEVPTVPPLQKPSVTRDAHGNVTIRIPAHLVRDNMVLRVPRKGGPMVTSQAPESRQDKKRSVVGAVGVIVAILIGLGAVAWSIVNFIRVVGGPIRV